MHLSENFNQSRLEISVYNLFHEMHPKVLCKIMKLTMQILMNTLGQTKQSLVLRMPPLWVNKPRDSRCKEKKYKPQSQPDRIAAFQSVLCFWEGLKECSKWFASLHFAFYIIVAFHCVYLLWVLCILQTIFDTFITVPNLIFCINRCMGF